MSFRKSGICKNAIAKVAKNGTLEPRVLSIVSNKLTKKINNEKAAVICKNRIKKFFAI